MLLKHRNLIHQPDPSCILNINSNRTTGGSIIDESAANNHGTNSGSEFASLNGVSGRKFVETTDHIDVGAGIEQITGAHTLVVVAKFLGDPETDDYQYSIFGGQNGVVEDAQGGMGLWVHYFTNRLTYNIYNDDKRSLCMKSYNDYTDQILHIVSRYTDLTNTTSDQNLFVNGDCVDAAGDNVIDGAIDWSGTTIHKIGNTNLNALHGIVFSCRLYTRAWADWEIDRDWQVWQKLCTPI